MLDEKITAALDQGIAAISEMCPPLWWGLYEGCKKQGFSDDQAMEILKTIVAQTIREAGKPAG